HPVAHLRHVAAGPPDAHRAGRTDRHPGTRPRQALSPPRAPRGQHPYHQTFTHHHWPKGVAMINDIKKDATTRMQKSVDALKHDLTKLRTGRASTALVDNLKVNYYGSDVPLSQVASVAI